MRPTVVGRLRGGNERQRASLSRSVLLLPGVAVLAAGLLPTFHDSLFSVTDVIFLALLPVTWSRARRLRPLRTLVQLCSLWLMSQVASNLVNGVPMGHLFGGIWQPVLLVASSLGVFWFSSGNPRHIAVLASAAFASLIAFGAITSPAGASADPWKYQFGIPATLLAVLAIGFLWAARRAVTSAVLTAGLGCLNIVLGFRSLGAICVTGAALLLVISMIHRANLWRISLALVAGVVASMATINAYGALAQSGRLGYSQHAKYSAQSGTQAGLLLAARPEALISLETIEHHPVLGVGSEAKLDYTATEQALEAVAAAGIELSPLHQERLLGDGLNSHSLALGAWVQAGVIAVLPWLYLVYLGLRSSFQAPCQRWARLRPVTVVWTLLCIWDFLFSPWSPRYQVLLGSFAALAAVQVTDHTEKRCGPCTAVLKREPVESRSLLGPIRGPSPTSSAVDEELLHSTYPLRRGSLDTPFRRR